MNFQPSINIVHDVGNIALFEQYVPNMKQLDIMNEVISNVLLKEQHAHLLIGPYGAGKSLVGALITTLITQKRITKEIKQFYKDVYTVSPDLEERLQTTLANKQLKWLPVTITGKTGDFESILLESIQKQCLNNGIQLTLKHDAAYIIELIEMWEQQYPDVYLKLQQVLETAEYTIELLIEKLEASETAAVALFKTLYTQIVAGTQYYNPNKIDFNEQLAYIFEQLLKKKMGLFIVFDEFGRFLQTISASKIAATMQHIQDTAELFNRLQNAGLLMITHTGLQQYSNSNMSLTQGELERVEKRFMEHRLESDSSIFYRSAHKLLQKEKGQLPDVFLSTDYDELSYGIMRYNLFPDMSNDEIEGTIIEGCQPIHPLTIQLLPSLSNILGQNDRTLYMFLNQFDIDAEQGRWYYADRLFDYFYPDETMLLTLDSMRYYRLALNYKVSEHALRVVKLGTLIKLLNNRFLLKEDFLQFALGLEEDQVASVLSELQEVKLLRYNPLNNAYELHEGSLVALDNIYNEVSRSFAITNTMREMALDEIHENRYYLPLGYNTEKSMTRYIERFFVIGDELITNERYKDGSIVYVIPQTLLEKEIVKQKAQSYTKNDILFGITSINMEVVGAIVDEYITLNHLLKSPMLLEEDINLKREVNLKLETLVFELHQHLHSITQFEDSAVEYYLSGEQVQIDSQECFEQFIDQWMFDRFPLTPEVRNESFNKLNVMPIQRKSAISLLDQLLNPMFTGGFEIEGTGPDYLIYATTFKNLDIDFHALNSLETKELVELRKRLVAFIEQNSRSSVMDLFNIALEEPFGIRKPLVPLLVVALLKDKWHQMAFYANDFSVANMTAAILYEIVEQEVEFYEYEIYQLSSDEQKALQSLNTVFFEDNSMANPNVLFKQLNQWLLRLARFTQVTTMQTELILNFKSIIRASETDPLTAIKKLVELDLTIEQLAAIKEGLESYVEQFKKVLNNDTLATFNVATIEEIRHKHEQAIQQSPQLKEIVFLYEEHGDIDGVILKVVGIPLKDWSDVTYDSYLTTLKQYLTVSNVEEIRLMDGDQVITTIQEVELSVKGKTIYNQLQRIVEAGGRTMNLEEVKYILYRILQDV
nr:hypothetical protein [Bacillus mobilis]